jgi:hypothetical protein
MRVREKEEEEEEGCERLPRESNIWCAMKDSGDGIVNEEKSR